MSNTWQVVTLKDITDRIGDGLHGTPKYEDNGEYYFINGNNLKNGQIFIDEKTKRASKEEFEKHKKELSDRTVLLSINGTLGNVAFYNNEKVFLGKSACYLNLKNSVDKHFIRYTLESLKFQNYIHTLATGSTIKNVSLKLVRDFQFELPSFETQVSISSYLRVIDEKFAVNTNINQTLEQIAQAIFKSWFVDFEPTKAKIAAREALLAENPDATPEHIATAEQQAAIQAIAGAGDFIPTEQLQTIADLFPNHLENSELGEIPDGWEVSEIGNEVKVCGGGTPSTKNAEFWDKGNIAWTTPKDLSGNISKILIDTDRKITELGLKKISSGLLPVNTVLLSSRAPVGYLALAKIPLAVNQGYIAMVCDKNITPEFVINWCDSVMDEIKQRASGTTFSEISKKNFKLIKMTLPPKALCEIYSLITQPLYNLISSNETESEMLKSIRDSILPKLLNGEIGSSPMEMNCE